MPFSRFRLVDDETVVDAFDSLLFVVVRLVRFTVDDRDESFVLRGRLSIDDCDDAAENK